MLLRRRNPRHPLETCIGGPPGPTAGLTGANSSSILMAEWDGTAEASFRENNHGATVDRSGLTMGRWVATNEWWP